MRKNCKVKGAQNASIFRYLFLFGVVLFLVGISTQSLQAQTITNGQNQTVKIVKDDQTKANPTNGVDSKVNEQLPYINYKGISDPEAAKEKWIQENPEEYAKLLEEQKAKQESSSKTPPNK